MSSVKYRPFCSDLNMYLYWKCDVSWIHMPTQRVVMMPTLPSLVATIDWHKDNLQWHECSWQPAVAPVTTKLASWQLSFSFLFSQFWEFQTENLYDTVMLYNGRSAETSQRIATLSGSPDMPLTYRSAANLLYVSFKSDHITIPGGFKANWTAGKEDWFVVGWYWTWSPMGYVARSTTIADASCGPSQYKDAVLPV